MKDGYGRKRGKPETFLLGIGQVRHRQQGLKCHRTFANLQLSFIPQICFIALGRNEIISHVSFHDLLKFVLNTPEGEEELWRKGPPYFCILIFNKGSEVEKQQLRDTDVSPYLNQVLMSDIFKIGGRLIYAQKWALLKVSGFEGCWFCATCMSES